MWQKDELVVRQICKEKQSVNFADSTDFSTIHAHCALTVQHKLLFALPVVFLVNCPYA